MVMYTMKIIKQPTNFVASQKLFVQKPFRSITPTTKLRRLQRSLLVQAQEKNSLDDPQIEKTPEKEETPPVVKQEVISPEVAKGRRTAIITGAVSVAFGVGYLFLVQLLDSRGTKLVPPPPEAYEN
eukprot:TRINITY_DN4764_c0_g2_i1.p2 TRINITY_DN4764_c0_g2~~TRINITY_DN4764_c0_g2_i1.p2  ORF type:complete len:126 (-),score=23.16 TRINITY_DN4764_c0_g2_i1:131-508(-)